MINNVKVQFTAEEETARDAEELAWANAKPMNDWKESMQITDSSMPRYLEDHITDGHEGDAGNEFLQVKYDAKIKLRGERP
jgi:type II secretory pathway component PulL